MSANKGVLILSTGKIVACGNNADILAVIGREYSSSEVCLGEMLDDISLIGCSIQDTVDIFAVVMNEFENDSLMQISEGEPVVRGHEHNFKLLEK